VEYDDRSAFAHATGHGTSADAIIEEMKEAGYRLVAHHDFLDRQSYLVFGPDDGTGE
jgi:cytosine/adenosine deaminase-related metal-dependent hydrolase